MLRLHWINLSAIAFAAIASSGCGGDSPQNSNNGGTMSFTVGGNVTGLSGSVVLQLNGANNLTVNASGAFLFPNAVQNGSAYTVTVLTQPASQTCTTNSQTGTVNGANVSTVTVICSSARFTVGGTVNGLSGSVVLRLNGGNDLTVNASGNFTFTTSVAASANYSVTVAAQPNLQVCGVTSGGNGTIANANVTNVIVTCSAFTIGGSISGLSGAGLILQLNSANDLVIANPSLNFAFPSTAVLGNSIGYSIHIKTQPAGQTCTIFKAAGIVTPVAPTVNAAAVACTYNVTDPLSGTYQIQTVQGQAVNVRGFLTFYPDGTYIFGLHSDDPTCTANSGNGIEYGVYRWNQTSHAFAIVTAAIDNNGDCGIVDGATFPVGTLVKNSDGSLTTDTLDTNGSGAHSIAKWTPVPSTSGTLVGSWGFNQAFTVFSATGTLFNADTRSPVQITSTSPGVEEGCYVLTGSTSAGSFTVDLGRSCTVGSLTAVDATGLSAGYSLWGMNAFNFTVTQDSMQTTIPGAGITSPIVFTRIVTN